MISLAIRLALNGGWIYLSKSERKNITDCIELLENADTQDKRLHMGAFVEGLGLNRRTSTHALNILMSVGAVKPQQYGRMRLFSLKAGYRTLIKTRTRRIGKDKKKPSP